MVLYWNPSNGNIELTDPEGQPDRLFQRRLRRRIPTVSVGTTGGPGNKSRMIYEFVGGQTTT